MNKLWVPPVHSTEYVAVGMTDYLNVGEMEIFTLYALNEISRWSFDAHTSAARCSISVWQCLYC